jgi:hypothetical protein
MAQRRNIAPRVLLEVRTRRPRHDLDAATARDARREDIKEARYHGIGRFPAL